MDFKRVRISATVPVENADRLRQALGEAGAGTVGEYTFCSFSVTGKGRFKPTADAHPYIGKADTLEVVDEELIEVLCDRATAKHVISVLKDVHPYEEVIVNITPIVEPEQL